MIADRNRELLNVNTGSGKFEPSLSTSEFNKLGKRLEDALGLRKPVVAVTFEPDTSVLRKSNDVVESSCVFWTKALDGAPLYTTPEQHQNCSIGAVTHGYRRAKDTVPGMGLADIELLSSVGWIGKDQILALPALPLEAERNIGYAPLTAPPSSPTWSYVLRLAASGAGARGRSRQQGDRQADMPGPAARQRGRRGDRPRLHGEQDEVGLHRLGDSRDREREEARGVRHAVGRHRFGRPQGEGRAQQESIA